MLTGRTIMVTGGAGFIGSNLVDRLLAYGNRVVAVDDLSTGSLDNLRPALHFVPDLFRFVHLDVTDEEELGALAQAVKPAVIYHLAAQMNVRVSVDDPHRDARVNVLGTVAVLEAARGAGTRKVVFATSGGCIYGDPPESALPVAETYPGHAHSPYGASKRSAEEYLRTYASLYGLRWTSLALSNVYGPRQDPSGEAGVIAIFLEQMSEDRPATIFGDGEQTRDFVHVSDVVDAFVGAVERGDGERINIGTGQRTSIRELASRLLELTGSSSAVRHAPGRPGELRHSALDIEKAASLLGWSPTIDLDLGLRSTISWAESRQVSHA